MPTPPRLMPLRYYRLLLAPAVARSARAHNMPLRRLIFATMPRLFHLHTPRHARHLILRRRGR